MKKCTFCNSDLPESAAFCPYCAHALAEKQPIHAPKARKRLYRAIIILILVLIAGVVIYEVTRPIQVEGEGKVTYQDGRDYYHLAVCLINDTSYPWPHITHLSSTVPPNTGYAFPLKLIVYREPLYDEALVSAFMEKVQYIDVTATPINGGEAMTPSHTAYDPDFPMAAAVCHLVYTEKSLLNEIRWQIHMKNGDEIIITHKAEAIPLESRDYHHAKYPMETTEDLQTLLDQISREIPRETVVNFYLPPVTYTEPLIINDRAVNLYGSSSADLCTTFTDTLWIQSRQPSIVTINNIRFEGNGGTGIHAHTGFSLENCQFSNWSTAVFLDEGASFALNHCYFTNNRTGVLWDTGSYGYFTDTLADNCFENNDIAFWIKKAPGSALLRFPNNVFTGNGINFQNDCNYPLDLSDIDID